MTNPTERKNQARRLAGPSDLERQRNPMTTTQPEPTREAVTVKVGAHLISLPAPARRSITTRKEAALSARKRLARYTNGVSDQPDGSRIVDLLWAQAAISRALWSETGGRYGSRHQTAAMALADIQAIRQAFPTGAL